MFTDAQTAIASGPMVNRVHFLDQQRVTPGEFNRQGLNEEDVMVIATHSAEVVGPVLYPETDGVNRTIPLGLCFVEELRNKSVRTFWGAIARNSAVLMGQGATEAANEGNLVFLDSYCRMRRGYSPRTQ